MDFICILKYLWISAHRTARPGTLVHVRAQRHCTVVVQYCVYAATMKTAGRIQQVIPRVRFNRALCLRFGPCTVAPVACTLISLKGPRRVGRLCVHTLVATDCNCGGAGLGGSCGCTAGDGGRVRDPVTSDDGGSVRTDHSVPKSEGEAKVGGCLLLG